MGTSAPQSPVTIRDEIRPGDIGYIIHLHGLLYAKEYGLDCTFEGYVADSLAQFVLAFDARTARLWVAESDEHIVGSIGIVGVSASEAQLRWFLVHPVCRGRGLGRTLLLEALRFCRDRGVASVFLWTFSELQTAAHLYRSVGFRKTEHKTHPIWGKMITEERYDLVLQADRERA
ncbi:MAG TPA: GNAT family N-acetyltransferase [Alphaproteobacteria bacterium]|nr:GNAT family N-acetyltransferase [Alphaproteobacteria bacterium]